MYSPLDMSEREAHERARPHLDESVIVHVTNRGIEIYPHTPGKRPQAKENNYLVRVEQDGSLRVVHKAL